MQADSDGDRKLGHEELDAIDADLKQLGVYLRDTASWQKFSASADSAGDDRLDVDDMRRYLELAHGF